MQHCLPPLTCVDENQLLIKYADLINREVRRYCVIASVDTAAHMDDLRSEAAIAFLLCCRSIPIQSMDLTALECRMCINKMRSAMRVCYWRIMNMGGQNKKPIDFNRSLTFTDICAVHSDDAEESDIDTVLGLGMEEDYSSVIVADFLKKISPIDQTILCMRMDKRDLSEISDVVCVKMPNIVKRIGILRKKWIPFFRDMGYAI